MQTIGIGIKMTLDPIKSLTTSCVAVQSKLNPVIILTPKQIRLNLIFLVLINASYWSGWTEIQLSLQPLLVYLKANNFIIGLIAGAPFMALIGIVLSPWITRNFKYKKKYLFTANIPYLGMLALVAVSIICSGYLHLSGQGLLYTVFFLVMAHWFFAGFVALPCQEFISACLPSSYMGRLIGYSFSIGGSAAIVTAAIGGWILLKVSPPASFGYVILIAWVIMQGGYVAALFAKEVPTPIENSPKPWSKTMIVAAWKDRHFMRFLLLYFLYYSLIMPVFIFVNIYGFKELQMIAATAAIMAAVTQIIKISASVPLGHIVDKFTPKRVMPYCFVISFLSMVILVLIPNQYGVYISIAISTAFNSLISSAQLGLITGLPSPENRAGHYSVQIIVQYAGMAIGPILVGYLCDIMPYKIVFITMAIVSLLLIFAAKRLLSILPDSMESYDSSAKRDGCL
jgi:MFS family permease